MQECYTVYIPEVGYWLESSEIRKLESEKNCKYMGSWFPCNETGDTDLTLQPLDIFYQPNHPDKYFGAFWKGTECYITPTPTVFKQDKEGVVTPDGVYVPLYEKEFKAFSGYRKCKVKVIGGDFIVIGERDNVR